MTFALLAVAGCGAGSSGDGMTSSSETSSSATTLASTTATTTTTAATTTAALAPVTSCAYPSWVGGRAYVKGDVIRYTPNGLFYRATNPNPGYDPTISTWYWTPFTCSTSTPPAPPPALAPAANCAHPSWVGGKAYATGNIVKYMPNGRFYMATNSNPGYDPTISTWYWAPFNCTTTTTTTTALAPAPASAPTPTALAPTEPAPAPASRTVGVLKPIAPQPMPSKLLYTYFELYGAGNVGQAALFNQINIFQGVFAQLSNPAAPATGELLPNYYSFTGATKEMVQAKREAGMRVGFTLGGEGAGGTVNMANHRTVARSVINMIVEKWGIIDFIDWNNFEADLYSDPAAMAAASRLVSNYFSGTHSAGNDPTTGAPHAFPNRDLGQNFYIGSAPGAFDAAGMGGDIALAIKNEMGLTRSYVGPQAYDGPGFELPSANQNRLNQWVSRGFPLSNIVWGSHPTTVSNSMSPDQSLAFYNTNAGLKGLYTFSYDDVGSLLWVQKMTPPVLLGR